MTAINVQRSGARSMRLSSKDARDFRRLAEGFGFELEGVTSNGHLRWVSPTYGEFVTSHTPRSWWWARKDLYEAMGVSMPVVKRRSKGKPSIVSRPSGANPVNRLITIARERGYQMKALWAENLLRHCRDDLADATFTLWFILNHADKRRARREVRQPWEPKAARGSA